ncbi:MAG: hypothetical protein E6I72_08455 [Chloroflexi bacterium]|nr:MAG: hypothetical protein E6I72_08455 [Chloroflexota bacterium]
MKTQHLDHDQPGGAVTDASVVVQLDPKEINLSPAFVDFVKSNLDRFGGKTEADILGEVRTHYAISPE